MSRTSRAYRWRARRAEAYSCAQNEIGRNTTTESMPAHPHDPDSSRPALSASPASPSHEGPTAELLGILQFALTRRRVFVAVPSLLAVVVCGIALATPRTFSSSFSFVPEVTEDKLANVSGFAAQLGLSLPGVDLTQTPDFYASLLRSKQTLREMVNAEYRVARDGPAAAANLIEIYEISAPSQAIAREEAVQELAGNMRVATDLKTGVVRAEVKATDPSLALQLSERALALVNLFNTQARRSRASQEARFVSERMIEAKRELRSAEDALQSFLERNREIASSPQLTFERDRLVREVSLRNDLYAALAQRLDQARIEEARTTPAITLVEQPILAARPDRRFLIYKGVTSLAAGAVAVGLYVLFRHSLMRAARAEPDAARNLLSTWDEMVHRQPRLERR